MTSASCQKGSLMVIVLVSCRLAPVRQRGGEERGGGEAPPGVCRNAQPQDVIRTHQQTAVHERAPRRVGQCPELWKTLDGCEAHTVGGAAAQVSVGEREDRTTRASTVWTWSAVSVPSTNIAEAVGIIGAAPPERGRRASGPRPRTVSGSGVTYSPPHWCGAAWLSSIAQCPSPPFRSLPSAGHAPQERQIPQAGSHTRGCPRRQRHPCRSAVRPSRRARRTPNNTRC